MRRLEPAARFRTLTEAVPGRQKLQADIARSTLRRIVEFWPYILITISMLGLLIKIYRGTI